MKQTNNFRLPQSLISKLNDCSSDAWRATVKALEVYWATLSATEYEQTELWRNGATDGFFDKYYVGLSHMLDICKEVFAVRKAFEGEGFRVDSEGSPKFGFDITRAFSPEHSLSSDDYKTLLKALNALGERENDPSKFEGLRLRFENMARADWGESPKQTLSGENVEGQDVEEADEAIADEYGGYSSEDILRAISPSDFPEPLSKSDFKIIISALETFNLATNRGNPLVWKDVEKVQGEPVHDFVYRESTLRLQRIEFMCEVFKKMADDSPAKDQVTEV